MSLIMRIVIGIMSINIWIKSFSFWKYLVLYLVLWFPVVLTVKYVELLLNSWLIFSGSHSSKKWFDLQGSSYWSDRFLPMSHIWIRGKKEPFFSLKTNKFMVVLKSTTCIFNVDLPLFVTKMQKLQIMVRIMNLNARFLTRQD